MFQIREKLLEKKTSLERSEMAKKLRAAKKFGKKVSNHIIFLQCVHFCNCVCLIKLMSMCHYLMD